MEMCKKPINGDDYAPITQALRGRLKVAALGLAKPMADGLLAECDNIDAIHKALEDEYAEMRTFVESLDDAAKKHEDVDLWGTRYIAGPVDSQGVPINFETPILREQMERLVTLLRNDCDIEASWDGLRRFWSIELTEDGCLMRDRACKAEAENAKLRKLVKGLMGHVMDPPCEGCIAEMSCDCSDLTQCDEWLFFEADARRLGIEVGE